MTAETHLSWALGRALEYIDLGDIDQAMASLTSDLHKYRGPRSELAAYDLPALLRAFEQGRPAVEQLMLQLELTPPAR